MLIKKVGFLRLHFANVQILNFIMWELGNVRIQTEFKDWLEFEELKERQISEIVEFSNEVDYVNPFFLKKPSSLQNLSIWESKNVRG